MQTAVDFALSSSVGSGELQYYQYPFPSNGLTVTLNVGTGRVYCYVSVTIQNPNEAQGYDWKVEATGYTDVFIDPLLVGGSAGEYVYVGIEGLATSGSNFTLNTTSGDRKGMLYHIKMFTINLEALLSNIQFHLHLMLAHQSVIPLMLELEYIFNTPSTVVE